MHDIDDRLRALLKLPEGTVLSDEERALGLAKVPKTQRERAEAEIDNMRFDIDRRPRVGRKFGGVR